MFHDSAVGVVKRGMAAMMTDQQFQLFMQHLIPTIQNQFVQQAQQQAPGDGATTTTYTPSGRKVTLHPKCFSRLDKFAGGEEKWREWSYDFRMATATQNATVFEILNWIEENGEHTFGEIVETDPEGIQKGRFNGMETIDKEIFQHLVLSTEEEAKMVVKAVENADGLQEDRGENHADPQGVYVPESGEGREVAHLGHFPVGGQMECYAEGDEGPERAGALEDGGVLGVVSE